MSALQIVSVIMLALVFLGITVPFVSISERWEGHWFQTVGHCFIVWNTFTIFPTLFISLAAWGMM